MAVFPFLCLLFVMQCLPVFPASFSSLVNRIESMDTVQQEVVPDQYVWIILFHKPKDISALAETWNTVASKTKGYLKVGAIDVSSSVGTKLAADIRLKDVPAILGFPSVVQTGPRAGDKIQIASYQGPLKVESIVSWGAKLLPSSLVGVFKSATEVEAFLEPEPDKKLPPMPKALLFTNKDKTSPLYKGLSLHFISRLMLGEVRTNEAPDVASKYNIEKFPSLIILKPDNPDPIKYEGTSFTADPLIEFLDQHALTVQELEEFRQKKMEEKERAAEEEKKRKEQEAKEAELRNLNPTIRVHTPQLWDQQVMEKGGITLVAWLDPAEERHKEYLRTLRGVWKKVQSGGTKIHFVWVDGTQQTALADFFGATGNMPAVTFINAKKNWWRFMIGAFELEKIWRYCRDQLLKGVPKDLDTQALPAFVEESNANGLQELDPEEEAELLNPTQPKKAKETKAQQPNQEQSTPKEAPKKPKKAPSQDKPSKSAAEIEARNREREEQKAAQRRANEERRQREKAERDAKVQAEKEARLAAKKKASKKEKPKGPAKPSDSGSAKESPSSSKKKPSGARPSNSYFEALKKKKPADDEL